MSGTAPAEAAARVAALPCWRGPVQPEPVAGGITNLNFRVADGGRRYFVRIGEDVPVHLVARWHERAVAHAAHAAGIAPAVVFEAPGVLVLEHLEGRTLTETAVREPGMLPRIVEVLRRFHREVPRHLAGPALAFNVFHVLAHYARLLQADGSPHAGLLPDLLARARELEARIGPVELVFGHNDLLAGNLIDDGERLWLVDYDYAGFNAALFDLGGLASNNGLDPAQEAELLRLYDGRPPDAERLHRLAAMKCASLLRETLWSMVSEGHSRLNFDYAAYTTENLQRFETAWAALEAR